MSNLISLILAAWQYNPTDLFLGSKFLIRHSFSDDNREQRSTNKMKVSLISGC